MRRTEEEGHGDLVRRSLELREEGGITRKLVMRRVHYCEEE